MQQELSTNWTMSPALPNTYNWFCPCYLEYRMLFQAITERLHQQQLPGNVSKQDSKRWKILQALGAGIVSVSSARKMQELETSDLDILCIHCNMSKAKESYKNKTKYNKMSFDGVSYNHLNM